MKKDGALTKSTGTIQDRDRNDTANCLSRWTFRYFSHLVGIAAKNERLELENCWRHGEKPTELYERFAERWKVERQKKRPSLFRVVASLSKGEFFFGMCCHICATTVHICLPIFLNLTVRFVEINVLYGQGDDCRAQVADKSDEMFCDPNFVIYLPSVFGVCLIVQSLFAAQASQSSLRLGLQFRTIAVTAIFRKTMRLSSIGSGTSSAGTIANLVSNDAQQFLQFAPMMHMGWSAPIFVVASFVMLASAVGPAFLMGVAVILVVLPYIILCLKKSFGARKAMLKFTDERVKLISDVLSGLRVIKAYGWEKAILHKMVDARSGELKMNAIRGFWSALMISGVFMVPVLNAIGIFSVYAATGGDFSASRIFTALAAMNNMRFPLVMGPFLLIQWSNFQIANQRIQAYLEVDEVPQAVQDRRSTFLVDGNGHVDTTPSAQVAVSIENADAAWAVPDPPPVKGKGKGKGKRSPCGCLGKRKKKVEGGEGEAGKGEGETGDGKVEGSGDGKGKGVNDKDAAQGKNIVTITKAEKDYSATQVLFGVNFLAKKGELTAIVGPVGSGKSSLLQCLLGSMEMMSGSTKLEGTVAYVAQQAFILNATIKKNITLSDSDVLTAEDEAFYQRVLMCCALSDDLRLLPGGDMTEIGERGVNLSGGQKQRISLARAVYSKAEIVLLDDPLSAVDAHVGKTLAEEVIADSGILEGKTRVLVTHQLQYLETCHQIYMLEDGRVQHAGDYATLTREGHIDTQQITQAEEKNGAQKAATLSTMEKMVSQKADGALVMQEERDEGALKFAVLWRYIRSGGTGTFWAWLVFVSMQLGSDLLTQSWLATWTTGSGMGVEKGDKHPISFYVGIYAGLGLSSGVFLFLRTYLLQVVHTRRVAQVLHDKMAESVFRSKMVFFDRNPLGRILNRFTRDIEFIDVMLVQSISQCVNCIGGTGAAIVIICIVYPYFIALAAVMLLIYYKFTSYFRYASREIQRLEAITRSPIFSLLTETQAGVSTIRGYGISPLIVHIAEKSCDVNTGVYYIMVQCTAWLQIRLDLLALGILLGVMVLPTCIPDLIDPGYVGLAMVYAFELNQLMKHGARMSAEVEQKFNAVDRIVDYTDNIEPEAAWSNDSDNLLPVVWPSAGTVSFKNVTMRYRPGLEPALRGVSFDVKGGEKIGICGRTGSGKSSLIVTLLRLTEFESGSVEVDGVNIQGMGLHSLRQRISMIPQDPVLFSASLRYNLDADPRGQGATDLELMVALEHVCLREEVEKLGGLDFAVAEGGQNFSVGQRQLLCLARSVIRRSHLVLLDEATASVDQENDDLIQKTIRREFKTATVITIAHRLNTILDSDRILVLEAGEVGEYDSPIALANDHSSHFHGLLVSACCTEFLEQASAAKDDATRSPTRSGCTQNSDPDPVPASKNTLADKETSMQSPCSPECDPPAEQGLASI